MNPNIPALGSQVTQLPTQVTVQPVPAGHPYAHHILPVDLEPSYTVLVDPKVPDAPEGQWWPPRALDADWLLEDPTHLPDILHVHFGFEHYSPCSCAVSWRCCARPAPPWWSPCTTSRTRT